MAKSYSIAAARHNLAAIVHELEQQPRIELTRRGVPVAVLVSIDTYRHLLPDATTFWEAYTEFRGTFELEQLDIDPTIFTAVRDMAPGREVTL